jgi:hypothetical protein
MERLQHTLKLTHKELTELRELLKGQCTSEALAALFYKVQAVLDANEDRLFQALMRKGQ